MRLLTRSGSDPQLWKLLTLLLASTFLTGIGHSLFAPISGAQLGNRRLLLTSAQISAVAEYELSFNLSSSGTLGSVRIEFCSNSPLPNVPCAPPGGLDAGNVVLTSQTGPGGFTVDSSSNNNTIVFSRTPGNAPVGPVSFHFTGISNPSSPGSYYARLQTFASTDATGSASNDGGIAFAIINALSITATVPPYLIFCTGVTISGLNCANADGDYIDLGELSSSSAKSSSSQMLVATNAQSGYNVTVDGTTMTSGNNAIAPLSSNDVSRPGTPQFGFNLHANVSPPGGSNPTGPGTGLPVAGYYQPNSYRFAAGDIIISNAEPDNLRQYTASYIVNVPKSQAPGIYVSTLTYICLASF